MPKVDGLNAVAKSETLIKSFFSPLSAISPFNPAIQWSKNLTEPRKIKKRTLLGITPSFTHPDGLQAWNIERLPSLVVMKLGRFSPWKEGCARQAPAYHRILSTMGVVIEKSGAEEDQEEEYQVNFVIYPQSFLIEMHKRDTPWHTNNEI